MKYYLLIVVGIVAVIALGYEPAPKPVYSKKQKETPVAEQAGITLNKPVFPDFIGGIQPPAGYKLLQMPEDNFGHWLLRLPLKKDNKLYLHNGSLKPNQTFHFAVLDVPYNRNVLQQCADAVMRLRAEYLYATKADTCIRFYHQPSKYFTCPTNCKRPQLESFLNTVFSWCGTYSLQTQMHAVKKVQEIKAGDVFVKGVSPGHAMLVAAVAQNKEGKKVFLLLQSFIPAQDIHIVINPYNAELSPWYDAEADVIATPGWSFRSTDLRKW